ncbi:GNAT family N-acetyltransferase [Paucibacter soli]|uniref:GNAT family N-acetyltransferase n=1 Tax=Paucibacter soli TaxID=3133433 RepID=UPI0030B4D651
MGFLDEPGTKFVTPRIGYEIVTSRRQLAHDNWSIDVTRGQTFPTSEGARITGGRYLMRDRRVGGRIIGAINFTCIENAGGREKMILSNIAVDPSFRRQGVASRLLDEVVTDHPRACLDSSMTSDGAAFFGYAPGVANKAPKRLRP